MKQIVDITRKIKRTNFKFNRANKVEKRLMVLKDAKAIIKANLVKINTGAVLFIQSNIGINDDVLMSQKELYNLDHLKQLRCNVCIKGMCLLSKQRVGNNIPENYKTSVRDDYHVLKDIYSKTELDILEIFFEGKIFTWHTRQAIDSTKGIVRYYNKSNITNRECILKLLDDLIKFKGSVNCLCNHLQKL